VHTLSLNTSLYNVINWKALSLERAYGDYGANGVAKLNKAVNYSVIATFPNISLVEAWNNLVSRLHLTIASRSERSPL